MLVPDYISEMPSLKHCNEISYNVGGFSVDRVRCGCDDDEVKLGKMLGTTRLASGWNYIHFSAFCKPEGMEDQCRCTRGPPPPHCEAGEMPQNCDCCGCSYQIPPLKPIEAFSSRHAKSPRKLRGDLFLRRLRSCATDRPNFLYSCTRANSYTANCYLKAAQMCPGASTCGSDRSDFLYSCTRGNSRNKSNCYLTASKMCPGARTCLSDKIDYMYHCKRENTRYDGNCDIVGNQMCR